MFNRRKEKALWQTLTTEENAAEIHRQLYEGMRPGTLASKLQGTDPPLFPGRTVNQVKAWFHAHRRKTVYGEWTRDVLGATKAARRGGLIKRLDVIADLEDVAVKMRSRFDRFFAYEARLVTEDSVPVQLAGLDDIARNYRATLVEVARLYLEIGVLYRVPKKIEAALTTAMDGRPPFEFTDEEVARFNRASLIEGMSREVIEAARNEAPDLDPDPDPDLAPDPHDA